MAIDANILLRGIVPDLGAAVSQGMNIGQAIRNAPILRKIQEQRLSQGEQELQSGELEQSDKQAAIMYGVMKDQQIDSTNYLPMMRTLEKFGFQFDPEDYEPSEENITSANQFKEVGRQIFEQKSGGREGIQTNAPIITEEPVLDENGEAITDANGNPVTQKYFTSFQADRRTGEPSVAKVPISGEIVDRLGLSPGDRVSQAQAEAMARASGEDIGKGATMEISSSTEAKTAERVERAKRLAADAVKASTAAFESAQNLENANNIFDSAIDALESGAETGPIDKWLPTYRASTLKLQEAIRKAGLNTISGVTLGAISKAELDLALSTDIDERMQPKDLLKHLKAKKAAQAKVSAELRRMGSFLEKEGNTIGKWNELQSKLGKSGVKLTGDNIPASKNGQQFQSKSGITFTVK